VQERPLDQLNDFERALDAATKRPKKKKVVREAVVEKAHADRVKADGGISFKFVSPSRRSVPDRLDLRPVPQAVRELVAKYVRFTECKRPGEVPTPSQLREHERLRALGYQVDVVDAVKPTEKDLFK
jgi:hypothetical protein